MQALRVLMLLIGSTVALQLTPMKAASRVTSQRAGVGPVMGPFDFLAFGKAGASVSLFEPCKPCGLCKDRSLFCGFLVHAVQHILVSDSGRANKIKAMIETGQISFADAAKEYSTCPSSAKGGDLGTFAEGAMVGAFNDYCFDVRRSRARAPVLLPVRSPSCC